MKSISGKKLCKIVENPAFFLNDFTGSHHIYENSNEQKILSIPVHRNQDLKIGTLKSIMKIVPLSEKDLQ
ncbi:MAG: type II toxin-antitoxin system HicA family toxin [Cyanobacteria bacterium P01_G01_bin.67]